MPFIDINSNAVVRHTARLERMHRSALPIAVRGSLNSAAFDVKKDTMPMEAKVFIHRAPTFFKATSKVNPAKGFDIRTMQSMVGFLPQSGSPKEKGGATEDLQQQEHSGTIGHRAFIPLKQARAGGSWNRRVTNKNRMSAINDKIVDSKNSAGRTKAAKFFSSAKHAGKGGLVIGNKTNGKGNKLLLRINSITRSGGRTIVNSTPLYSVKGKRAVKIKQTKFMEKASLLSAAKVEKYYIIEAQKQIAKLP